jgi:hypothetical protein
MLNKGLRPLFFDYTTPRRGIIRSFLPMPYDLFGEIPVTEDEIFEWVSAVAPRWLTQSVCIICTLLFA